ncbi:MAG: hypothetical protein HZB24_01100 [Desulfobacterales bacterium]|nr:hypothetical protein [Desulfobacterales bacterium]
MLSSSFSIDEFMEKVKGHTFQEIIQTTDREATAAERMVCKLCRQGGCDPIVGYARCLKDFILYMRHGVRTRRLSRLNLSAFKHAHSRN